MAERTRGSVHPAKFANHIVGLGKSRLVCHVATLRGFRTHGNAKNYGLAMTTETAIKLRELRMRAGLSMQAVAKAAGYRGASSYQRYEDPASFSDEKLPLKLVARLADVLVGKGSPPITQSEVLNLAGINSIQAATDAAHVFDGGFSENGAEPIGESPADGLRLAEHVAPFRILNNAMNRHPLAMVEGDTAYADCSGETVENIQMGDAVIVQCMPRTADGEGRFRAEHAAFVLLDALTDIIALHDAGAPLCADADARQAALAETCARLLLKKSSARTGLSCSAE